MMTMTTATLYAAIALYTYAILRLMIALDAHLKNHCLWRGSQIDSIQYTISELTYKRTATRCLYATSLGLVFLMVSIYLTHIT